MFIGYFNNLSSLCADLLLSFTVFTMFKWDFALGNEYSGLAFLLIN